MRISDWSSDVCSSDLIVANAGADVFGRLAAGQARRARSHRHRFPIAEVRMAPACVALRPIVEITQHLIVRRLDIIALVEGLDRAFSVAVEDHRLAPGIVLAADVVRIELGAGTRYGSG